VKLKNLLAVILAIAPAALAQSVAGLWQATLTTKEAEIPFRLEIAGDGAAVQGWFSMAIRRSAQPADVSRTASLFSISTYTPPGWKLR
jgi:hypothetical protein